MMQIIKKKWFSLVLLVLLFSILFLTAGCTQSFAKEVEEVTKDNISPLFNLLFTKHPRWGLFIVVLTITTIFAELTVGSLNVMYAGRQAPQGVTPEQLAAQRGSIARGIRFLFFLFALIGTYKMPPRVMTQWMNFFDKFPEIIIKIVIYAPPLILFYVWFINPILHHQETGLGRWLFLFPVWVLLTLWWSGSLFGNP